MRIALIFLSIVLFAPMASGQTSLYRWVDEKGRVHYSDRPSGDAQQYVVPEPSTYDSRAASPPPAAAPAEPPESEETAPPPVRYESVGIASPTEDQVLWNIFGALPVSVVVAPALQPDHSLRVIYDGAEVDWPPGATSHTLQEVWRGTHTLQVSVVDATGAPLVSSPPVTFHVRQSTIRRRVN